MGSNIKTKPLDLLLQARIESKVYLIRGKQVMLDEDLAGLYEVSTKRLNEQVKRNIKRFPDDFMFQLNKNELDNLVSQNVIPSLRSQIATSNRGGRRYPPYAFTQEGVAMLSGVLNSDKAININIQIMRVFVRIKEILLEHKNLKEKIEAMEKEYKKEFVKIFFEIYKLDHKLNNLFEEKKSKKPIGFSIK